MHSRAHLISAPQARTHARPLQPLRKEVLHDIGVLNKSTQGPSSASSSNPIGDLTEVGENEKDVESRRPPDANPRAASCIKVPFGGYGSKALAAPTTASVPFPATYNTSYGCREGSGQACASTPRGAASRAAEKVFSALIRPIRQVPCCSPENTFNSHYLYRASEGVRARISEATMHLSH